MTVNFGDHHLIVHNVDLAAWCERYGLRPFEGRCGRCGRAVSVSRPFVARDRRGLCADACACGNDTLPFTFVDFNYPAMGFHVEERG